MGCGGANWDALAHSPSDGHEARRGAGDRLQVEVPPGETLRTQASSPGSGPGSAPDDRRTRAAGSPHCGMQRTWRASATAGFGRAVATFPVGRGDLPGVTKWDE